MSDIFLIFAGKLMKTMEEKKPIDGAEYISLEEAKRLKLPYFEGAAAGFPSPAADYQR
jgi:hypothetical protein